MRARERRGAYFVDQEMEFRTTNISDPHVPGVEKGEDHAISINEARLAAANQVIVSAPSWTQRYGRVQLIRVATR